jgi:hypothetical protein
MKVIDSMFARATRTLALVFGLALSVTACGGSADPETTCKDLCSGAGYSTSRVDSYPHEVNCFCTGGSGTVTAESCTKMCTDLGKTSAMTFKSTGTAVDSCQCS